MNRKEMGFSVAGMLGALAGTACSPPLKSSALPAASDDVDATAVPLPVNVTEVLLALPTSKGSYFSFFRMQKTAPCKVTSSDPSVCKVTELPTGAVEFSAVSVGHADVLVDDLAARKGIIRVYVVSGCSNGKDTHDGKAEGRSTERPW
jgi:hypothetical protein